MKKAFVVAIAAFVALLGVSRQADARAASPSISWVCWQVNDGPGTWIIGDDASDETSAFINLMDAGGGYDSFACASNYGDYNEY